MDFEAWRKKKYEDEIAPVKETAEETPDETLNFDEWRKKKHEVNSDSKWYNGYFQQSEAFADGYNVGDITKTLLGTGVDVANDSITGVLGWGENAIDAGASMAGIASELLGLDGAADKLNAFVQKDLYDENALAGKLLRSNVLSLVTPAAAVFTPIAIYSMAEKWANPEGNDNSVLGDASDAVIQSTGETLAKLGVTAITGSPIPADIITGITVFGEQSEQALRDDANFKQAGGSALISAAAEIIFEKISGGIKFGGKTLDDGLTKLLAKNISNVALRTLADLGLDISGEAFEEVATEFVGNLGTLLYEKEEVGDVLFSKDSLIQYIQAGISGGVMGGAFSAPKAVGGVANNVDYKTGMTNEQFAADQEADKVVNALVEEQTKDKELTAKEKRKIRENIENMLERGELAIEDIERIVGGDDYSNWKKETDRQKALDDELNKLLDTEESKMTVRQRERLTELRAMKPNTNMVDALKSSLDERVAKATVPGSRLSESYTQRAARGQKFEADLSKYSKEEAAIVKKAADSGFLNNTRTTHEFVDWIARVCAKKGIDFDFLNNEKLKESGFSVEGATINGFWDEARKTIGLNMNSKKAFKTVIGHEIMHVLEGTGLANDFSNTITEYAKGKHDYESRLEQLKKIYKNKSDAEIERELVADLVGDYLFTDEAFLKRLSVENRNVFQKLWDEVKYLHRLATAGSEQARELERIKHMFEKVYRESEVKAAEGTRYSLDNNLNNEYNVYTERISYDLSVRDYSLREITNLYARRVLEPEYDALFDKVFAFCMDANVAFTVEPVVINEQGKEVSGKHGKGVVTLSQKHFNSKAYTNEQKSRVILHEMLHAATTYAMVNYYKIRKGDATVQMPKNIYDSCMEINRVFNAIKESPNFEGMYGKKDSLEMIAELSNPVFVEKLKNSYPTKWDDILSCVCRVFGINKSFSNYDKLKKAVDEILTHPDYQLAKDYFVGDGKKTRYLNEAQYAEAEMTDEQRRDNEYMKAVESGNMETAQSMVNRAAKAAGFTTPLQYHGSGSFGFTKFREGRIYTTSSLGVAMGYNRGQGLGRIRSASKGYIPNDGTADTAIKNAKNVLGATLTKFDDAAKQNIIRKADSILKNIANKVAELDEVTDYGKAAEFFEYLTEKYGEEKSTQWTNQLDSLHYMLASEYTANDIIEDGNWLAHDLERYHEWKQSLSELWSEEHEAIKNSTLDKVFRYLLGYEYGDALIDIEYGLGRLIDSREKLVNERGSLIYLDEIIADIEQMKNTGVYQLYGNVGEKPLIIDEGKVFWDSIPFEGKFRSTDYIANWAKENGYTSVLFKTVLDPSSGGSSNVYADEYVFFDSEQVKSADVVTYDDNGNVIPLSERFKESNNDIRYSLSPDGEDAEPIAFNESVRYQGDIAPVPTANAEDIAPVRGDVPQTETTVTEQVVPETVAPVTEKDLDALLEQRSNVVRRSLEIESKKDRTKSDIEELERIYKQLDDIEFEADAIRRKLYPAALYNKSDGENGWRDVYDGAHSAVNSAVKEINPKLWAAFRDETDIESNGGEIPPGSQPFTAAFIAVHSEVRGDEITPMQGAQLLSNVYNEGGAEALGKIYYLYTGNLYPKYLEQAKKYDTVAPAIAPDSVTNAPTLYDLYDERIENIAPLPTARKVAQTTPKKVDNLPMREDIAPLPKANAEVGDIAPVPATGGKRRSFATTAVNSDTVQGQVLFEDLDQAVAHYEPIPNAVTLTKADNKLSAMGYQKSVDYFNGQMNARKVALEDIALGERLIQESIARGDTKTAGELIQNMAILGTELGQKVQALSIIKRLTPEGQVLMLDKIIQRGKTRGDHAYDGVEFTQDMKDHILKVYDTDGAYDQDALNAAVEDVKQRIADQMKVSLMDKVNAWRYLSMLGNPKTHIRNVVSNVAMRATVAVKNAVARTVEDIAPIKNKTKTWRRATQSVKTYADNMAAEMRDVISDGGKYNEEASIKDKRKMFKIEVLDKVYEFNNDMLSKEDWWFSKAAYRDALSEYLTANGIKTFDDINKNPKIVEKGKQYALEQSQIATFRQASWLANKIGEIERKNAATEIAVGAVLPFKKTPINIAKTALNYSPLGFTKTLTYDIAQVKNGKMEASQLVDHLSQNLTGTGLTVLGYLLASIGFINGAGDDDKEGKYDYQLGKQAYSINIGDATYSLSWLSPVAMPLFVGANAYEQLVEKNEWNGDVVMQTLAQTLDPLSEMSFLSSLDDVLSSYDSGVEKFASIGVSAAQSYISQFVPTLSSQVASVLDSKKRTTKVSADSGFKAVEETINELMYKIPLLRNTLEPSTDIWGQTVKQNDNFVGRAFETFLAPYSKKELIATEIDTELKRLYSETGENGVIPSIPGNTFTYQKVKYEMSAEEYTDYKMIYGQTANILFERLFATKEYQRASDKEKAKMVSKVYDIAKEDAREYILEGREGE